MQAYICFQPIIRVTISKTAVTISTDDYLQLFERIKNKKAMLSAIMNEVPVSGQHYTDLLNHLDANL